MTLNKYIMLLLSRPGDTQSVTVVDFILIDAMYLNAQKPQTVFYFRHNHSNLFQQNISSKINGFIGVCNDNG